MLFNLQIFKQTLKKDFIKLLWTMLTALLIGIVAYFGIKIGLKKCFDQLGKPPVTKTIHKQ